MNAVLRMLSAAARRVVLGPPDRRRPGYHDGTERPALIPPTRYARAVAAPAPGGG